MLKRKTLEDQTCIVCSVVINISKINNMCFECQNIADVDSKEWKRDVGSISIDEDLSEFDQWETNYYNSPQKTIIASNNNNNNSHNNTNNNNSTSKYHFTPLQKNNVIISNTSSPIFNKENIENNNLSPNNSTRIHISPNNNSSNNNNKINTTPTNSHSKQQKITSFLSPKKTFMDTWLGIEPKPNNNTNNTFSITNNNNNNKISNISNNNNNNNNNNYNNNNNNYNNNNKNTNSNNNNYFNNCNGNHYNDNKHNDNDYSHDNNHNNNNNYNSNSLQKISTNPPSVNNKNNNHERKNNSARKSWQQQYYADAAPLKRFPFYKRVEGTNFFVDAFRFDCNLPNGEEKYFLSHFHSDHYGGITAGWNKGRIICSPVTGTLVRSQLRVSPEFIWTVPFTHPLYLDGIKITLLDANHCPGSCMFLFEWQDKRVLHVGDFRYCNKMKECEHLKLPLSSVYLDTTYCNPAYSFPTQDVVINHVADIVAQNLNHTLFVVGTYTIGKERVIVKLVETFNLKVFARPAKKRVLLQLDLPKVFNDSLTTNPEEALIHIVPLWEISFEKLSALQKYQPNIVAIKPTGWTHSSTKGSLSSCSRKGDIAIYGVPYSEHSSFTELREFVQFTRPQKIIPTVNNSSGAKVKEMLDLLK